jgi:hypothetical protein
MNNRDEKDRDLQFALSKWVSDTAWQIEIGEFSSYEDYSQTLIYRQGKPWVRNGYALREILICAGRYLEFLDTVELLWAPDLDWTGSRRSKIKSQVRTTIEHVLGPSSVLIVEDVPGVLSDFDSIEKSGNSYHLAQLDLEEQVFLLAELRESYLVERAFRELNVAYRDETSVQVEETKNTLFEGLSEERIATLSWALDNYKISEWLFSWMKTFDQRSFRNVYQPIFAIYESDLEKVMSRIDPIWISVSNELDEDFDDRENLRSMIERITVAVSEIGYDGVAAAIVSHGGQSGRESMIGNLQPINLIPSESTGECCRLVLVVAHGGKASRKRGFPSVMRQLRAHLISCARESKLVVILTNTWDPKLIEESRLDLLAHRQQGTKFVALLATGNSITHIPFEL